jgi:4-carboxymuconolactone decarboxylase
VVERVRELSPELARQIVEFGYGDAYDESSLPARERQLVTIGALTALGGCEGQLEVHMHIARNVGLTPTEIVAAVAHTVPYAGFPRALNALEVARRVFERRDDAMPLDEAGG